MIEKILIIGAGGQIGTELTEALREIHGEANVIASDIRQSIDVPNYVKIDVTNKEELFNCVRERDCGRCTRTGC